MIAASTFKILVNNAASANRQNAGDQALHSLIKGLGIHAEIISTKSEEEMDSMLQQIVAEGADRVGISGGPGTVSRAVQRLAHTSTALGILPQGTANNFATALCLPMDLP